MSTNNDREKETELERERERERGKKLLLLFDVVPFLSSFLSLLPFVSVCLRGDCRRAAARGGGSGKWPAYSLPIEGGKKAATKRWRMHANECPFSCRPTWLESREKHTKLRIVS